MKSCLLVSVLYLSFFISSAFADHAGDDPDTKRTFEEVVTSKGYPCESHQVTTTDGYILTMHRVPFGRKGKGGPRRPPVLLQHGLLDCSFTWIINMPDQSFPYILADAGYDVWMGNSRGNKYSKAHKKLSPKDPAFWNFSWDEMAKYDFPEQIDYVLGQTGFSNLSYVGHSQGTIQAFAALASRPELAKKLNIFVGYGPLITVSYMTNTVLYQLAINHFDTLLKLYGINEFMEIPPILNGFVSGFCQACPICCEDVIEFLCGKHQGAFNDSRMSVMGAHEPGGTSMQCVIHWGQLVRTKTFQMFDYGKEQNIRIYGQDTPPPYPMQQFPPNLPVLLYSGGKDELADPEDVLFLVDQLPKNGNVKSFNIPEYAHLDFAWATDANVRLYKPTISVLNSINFPSSSEEIISSSSKR